MDASEQREAYSVDSFCDAYGIGRTLLYRLWSEGKGPRRMKVGERTLISREAAARWRRELEGSPSPRSSA